MAVKTRWIFDCGNTQVKWAAFQGHELVATALGDAVEAALAAQAAPEKILVAASGLVPDWLDKKLLTWPDDVLVLKPGQATGVPTEYATPETLGLDRLANAAAIRAMQPAGCAVIVDAGTCVTVDVVVDGVLLGGSIAPGGQMRMGALAHFTASLPALGMPDRSFRPGDLGTSTSTSMWAGAWGGLSAEVSGRLREFGKVWPDINVYITGGDAKHLQLPDDCRIFADPLLTLKGFRNILEHIADN
jgi:type III pantothenate kinase